MDACKKLKSIKGKADQFFCSHGSQFLNEKVFYLPMDQEGSDLRESVDTSGTTDTFATALEARTASSINSTPTYIDPTDEAQFASLPPDTGDINPRPPEASYISHLGNARSITNGDTTITSDLQNTRPLSATPPPSNILEHQSRQKQANALRNDATSSHHDGNISAQDPSHPSHSHNDPATLGASLFSVPPAETPTTGVYSMPIEAFQFKDLDSGKIFYMDKRYWIKDVDSGKVYIVHPDSDPSTAATGSDSRVRQQGGHEKESISTEANLRISDLLSGDDLTLVEFEQVLGYFKEASRYHKKKGGLVSDDDESDEEEDSMNAQEMAQLGLESLRLGRKNIDHY